MPTTRARPPTHIRDVQVIKHDRSFFLADRYGDVNVRKVKIVDVD